MFLLWHPWLTTTNLSYSFPLLETSATASCGTTGKIICTCYPQQQFMCNDCKAAGSDVNQSTGVSAFIHWSLLFWIGWLHFEVEGEPLQRALKNWFQSLNSRSYVHLFNSIDFPLSLGRVFFIWLLLLNRIEIITSRFSKNCPDPRGEHFLPIFSLLVLAVPCRLLRLLCMFWLGLMQAVGHLFDESTDPP